MSCYLTFYGVPKVDLVKKEDGSEIKPIPIVSFSRNNDIYRYFDENCNIYFCFDKTDYTEINDSHINLIENDIKEDIRKSEKRLTEYEKVAHDNPELVNEIISIKEYLEDLYTALHYTEFISFMVNECSSYTTIGFSKIVANLG